MKNHYLPVVVQAEYQDNYIIKVEFDNGVQKTIDFSSWLEGEIFKPLKDKMYFQRFFLDGWTVAWPNGADIAPETLYEAENLSEQETNVSITA
jgi:hypothetical protein